MSRTPPLADRDLVEFLYADKPRRDDVVAIDFLIDPDQWRASVMSDNLRTAWQRSHKELAHLTTARLPESSPDRGWPVWKLVKEIRNLMQRFSIIASQARLDSCVTTVLEQRPAMIPTGTDAASSTISSITGGARSFLAETGTKLNR